MTERSACAGKGPKRSRAEADDAADLPLAALAIEGAMAAQQPEQKQVSTHSFFQSCPAI